MPASEGERARGRLTPRDVESAMERLFVDAEGTSLRREDRKKSVEVAAILNELSRVVRRDEPLVDAAAGKAYVGLLAAELLGKTRVIVIEREAARVAAARLAASKLSRDAEITFAEDDVASSTAFRDAPVVVALHACGPASDAILDAATRHEARWLLLVPCCYADAVPFAAAARRRADALGLPKHAEVRRRFVESLIDAERTLRLESRGYETTVIPFVAKTVTPHNLLWRARRVREPVRMREAEERLLRLHRVD